MTTIEEQIREIEEEISNTKYNKATQHHIGKLKAKLARLRQESEARAEAGRGAGRGYAISKSGNATMAIVGLPSSGKSTLLNQLTEADSEVGHFDFTTLSVVPGTLHYRGANIQMLDLPGLIEGASRGRGRGREVLSVVRSADLILLLVDVYRPEVDVLVRELHTAGLRLNETEADLVVTPRNRGGINVRSTVPLTVLDEELVGSMVREYGVVNADVVLRQDVDEDQLIDYLRGNRRYVQAIAAVNKVDAVPEEVWRPILEDVESREFPTLPISADKGTNLDVLKGVIYDNLNLMAIYMRPRGGPTDYEEPLIIRRNATVRNVCDTIHREIRRRFRYANVWGESAKFPGQRVGLDHILQDADVVTIVQRR